METAHNLLIDFPWSHDYAQVYVMPPHVVKTSRRRFGFSGARTDASDAHLLADLLRTDRARLDPWHPESPLVRQLGAKVSFVQHLTRQSVRLSNRLRAVLGRYYPAALFVFGNLTTRTALEFIRTYPTPEQAEALAWPEFREFTRQHRYPPTPEIESVLCAVATRSTCGERRDDPSVSRGSRAIGHAVVERGESQAIDFAKCSNYFSAIQTVQSWPCCRVSGSCWRRHCWPSSAMTVTVSRHPPVSKGWRGRVPSPNHPTI